MVLFVLLSSAENGQLKSNNKFFSSFEQLAHFMYSSLRRRLAHWPSVRYIIENMKYWNTALFATTPIESLRYVRGLVNSAAQEVNTRPAAENVKRRVEVLRWHPMIRFSDMDAKVEVGLLCFSTVYWSVFIIYVNIKQPDRFFPLKFTRNRD